MLPRLHSKPPDRRLILRTHELDGSHQRLAEFLQIPVEQLDSNKGRLNRSTWAGRIESFVEPAYLNEMVAKTCGENMARHFPEIAGVKDAYALWESGVPSD